MKILIVFAIQLLTTTVISTNVNDLNPCDDMCKCTDEVIECPSFVPKQIPFGITEVIINGRLVFNGSNGSWENVKSLTFNGMTSSGIDDGIFEHLINLEHFAIHSEYFDQLKKKHMRLLHNLEKLDLSGTLRLMIPTLAEAISGTVLPNLKYLNIDSINSGYDYSVPASSTELFKELQNKPNIKELVMTNMWVTIDVNDVVKSPVEILNISGDWVPKTRDIIPFPFNLRELDISNSEVVTLLLRNKKEDIRTGVHDGCSRKEFVFVFELEKLYANNLVKTTILTVKTFEVDLDNGCFSWNLKELVFRQNNLRYFEVEIKTNKTVPLEILDLSENNMEYISPKFFAHCQSLQKLYLDTNRLHKMNISEFRSIFLNLFSLEELSLSSNGLTYINADMFIKNQNLKVLDLSQNNIQIVEIVSFLFLHAFHLSKNRISTFSKYDVQRLRSRMCKFYERIICGNSSISINSNPLSCTCNNKYFVQWIVDIHSRDTKVPTCNLDGHDTNIRAGILDKVEEVCRRKIVMTISLVVSTVSLLGVAIVTTVFLQRRRSMRHRDAMANIRNDIEAREGNERYLLFISFCSENSEIADNEIRPKFSNELENIVGCNRNIICNGDKHFRCGFPINDEIMRNIENSLVTLCVVSNAFLESSWCETEIREAYLQNKPILLLITEEINLENMSYFMRMIYDRFVRAKLIKTEQGYLFVPDLRSICESILQLAVKGYRI